MLNSLLNSTRPRSCLIGNEVDGEKWVTIFYYFCVAVQRRKTAECRRVKYCGTLILAVLFASLAFSEDFKTVSGKVYKDATVSRVEGDGIVLKTEKGIFKVYFAELPQEVQERFHWAKPEPPREPFYSPWQPRPKIRLFWQKSSLPGLLSSPASRLLWVISVLDESQHCDQAVHRDGKRFIVRRSRGNRKVSLVSLEVRQRGSRRHHSF